MRSSFLNWIVPSVVLCVALFSTSGTQAQIEKGRRESGGEVPGLSPRETAIPAEGAVVPMQRFQSLPHVTAYINKKGPYRLVVDTGAPLLCLNNTVADELKLPSAGLAGGSGGPTMVRSPGGAGRPARGCEVESLKIGDAEFRGVRALASDTPFTNDFDGVLGLAVFADCLLTFDYPAGELRLARGELPPSDGREVLPYVSRRGKVLLTAEVDGRPFDFVLDTGASLWFKFPEAVTKRCSYLYGPVEGAKARTIDRELVIRMARLSNRLQLGRHIFEHPYGAVEDEHDMAVIGSGALDDFVLTLDQQTKRLRLARAGNETIVPPPFRVFGFGMRRTGDGIKVDYVLPNSPAQRAGLKAGDVIIALADKPVEEIHGRPIMKELAKKESIKVRYARASDTQEREIELPIFELLP